jgi:hypothetical protein
MYLHLLPKLIMRGAIPPLSQYVFTAGKNVKLSLCRNNHHAMKKYRGSAGVEVQLQAFLAS